MYLLQFRSTIHGEQKHSQLWLHCGPVPWPVFSKFAVDIFVFVTEECLTHTLNRWTYGKTDSRSAGHAWLHSKFLIGEERIYFTKSGVTNFS